MNIQSNETNVDAIDEILRRYPWLDMSIIDDNGCDTTVSGSLSESYPSDIRLTFFNVLCIVARRDWRTDTSARIIKEVFGDSEFNRSFHVEQGYRVFELVAEDSPLNMRFVASKVRLDVLRLPPDA